MSVTSKGLPAPAEATPEPTAANDTVQKAEAAVELKVEAAAEAAPEINSVPKPEVKAESLPGISKPLSPFPYVILHFSCYMNFFLKFYQASW